jgi:hypothetical protein
MNTILTSWQEIQYGDGPIAKTVRREDPEEHLAQGEGRGWQWEKERPVPGA